MILHTDIPDRLEVSRLLSHRRPGTVSIYIATDPVSTGDAERIAFKNLAAQATAQLQGGDMAQADLLAVQEQTDELTADDTFWRYQARSLAVFVTPQSLTSFRLPNRLLDLVEVSDRFYVKPLMRAVTFPQVAFVLAVAQGSVRVVEVTADSGPWKIAVDDLPTDVAAAVGKSSIADRAPSRKIQGSEGQKVRMRQYARQINQALRPLLAGLEIPLILAATEPMDSIYRSVNTYPALAPETISGNPEVASDAELANGARGILDRLYREELRQLHELFEVRTGQERTLTDVAEVARAATFGAVDTVLVDIDKPVPGTVDEDTGAVSFTPHVSAHSYGVVDEIARRVWLQGGRILALRQDDIPGPGPVAAILRYRP